MVYRLGVLRDYSLFYNNRGEHVNQTGFPDGLQSSPIRMVLTQSCLDDFPYIHVIRLVVG